MVYQVATQAPIRSQFEPLSGTLWASQVFNCGLTCVTHIADFWWTRRYGIESNRALIKGMGPYNVNGQIYYGAPPGTATTAWQQRDMLRARGVACEIYGIGSVAQLRALVTGGKRPVLLGLNFARVANSIAGHDFNGWHAITILNSIVDTTSGRGFLIDDSNFAPGESRARRFYPDSTMAWALADPETNWAVVPITPKALPTSSSPSPVLAFTEATEMAIMSNIQFGQGRLFGVRAGTILRKGPGTKYPVHWKVDKTQDFWFHGFVPDETGWVAASRSKSSRGLFFVPPEH